MIRIHTQVVPMSRIVDTGAYQAVLLIDFRRTDLVCGHGHLDPSEAFQCRRDLKAYWEKAVSHPDFTIVEVTKDIMQARWDKRPDGRYWTIKEFRWLDQ